jgi:hypothetical protein
MAHKTLEDGRKVIDWTTGDPEGDRKWMMKNYRDFVIQIQNELTTNTQGADDIVENITALFQLWKIDVRNQVDDFPRIWIKRPE